MGGHHGTRWLLLCAIPVRRRQKRAVVPVARAMLSVAYHASKDGRPYDDPRATCFERLVSTSTILAMRVLLDGWAVSRSAGYQEGRYPPGVSLPPCGSRCRRESPPSHIWTWWPQSKMADVEPSTCQGSATSCSPSRPRPPWPRPCSRRPAQGLGRPFTTFSRDEVAKASDRSLPDVTISQLFGWGGPALHKKSPRTHIRVDWCRAYQERG